MKQILFLTALFSVFVPQVRGEVVYRTAHFHVVSDWVQFMRKPAPKTPSFLEIFADELEEKYRGKIKGAPLKIAIHKGRAWVNLEVGTESMPSFDLPNLEVHDLVERAAYYLGLIEEMTVVVQFVIDNKILAPENWKFKLEEARLKRTLLIAELRSRIAAQDEGSYAAAVDLIRLGGFSDRKAMLAAVVEIPGLCGASIESFVHANYHSACRDFCGKGNVVRYLQVLASRRLTR